MCQNSEKNSNFFVDDKQWCKFEDILNVSTVVKDVVQDFIHPLNATVGTYLRRFILKPHFDQNNNVASYPGSLHLDHTF